MTTSSLDYIQPNCLALLSNVPIQYLDQVKTQFKNKNMKIRIRYRGPRNTTIDQSRSVLSRRLDCLKENATAFSLYIDQR